MTKISIGEHGPGLESRRVLLLQCLRGPLPVRDSEARELPRADAREELRYGASHDVVHGWGGNSHKLGDWLVALVVTGGVTELVMTGPTPSRGKS